MTVGKVKLQKHLTHETKDGTKYYKWVVVLPKEEVEGADWEEGEELEAEVKGRKIILEPKEE